MRCAPTDTGGRVVEGDTPYGKFRVEWDADNVQVSESMQKRTPDTPDTIAKPGTAIANTLARAGFHKCPPCHKRAAWLDRQWYKIACAWRCLTR